MPQDDLEFERAITTRQCGDILGLDEVTLQQRRARGLGPRFFRIGRTIRYRLGDVLAFRDARMIAKAEAAAVPARLTRPPTTVWVECPACLGGGERGEDVCAECAGACVVERPRPIVVP